MVRKDAKIIANIPKNDMIFGKEEREHYNKQTKCWMCGGEFNDKDVYYVKVRVHCHFTGRYRGAAHNKCNFYIKNLNSHLWWFITLLGMIAIYL